MFRKKLLVAVIMATVISNTLVSFAGAKVSDKKVLDIAVQSEVSAEAETETVEEFTAEEIWWRQQQEALRQQQEAMQKQLELQQQWYEAQQEMLATQQKYAEELMEKRKEDAPDIAVSFAVSKLGYDYSMERRSSGYAYDCSSLVYYAYLDAGYNLGFEGMTTAAGIAKGLTLHGKETSVSDLQKGDLIFYSYKKNGRFRNISHVAMYIGDGKVVHASATHDEVEITSLFLDGFVCVCRPTL